MKKSVLLVVAMVLLCLPMTAFAQQYVKSGTIVQVKPKTLYYFGTGLELEDGALMTNNGNVKVAGTEFVVSGNTNSATNFLNEWTTNGEATATGIPTTDGYGQLWIEGDVASISGHINQKRAPVATNSFYWLQVGIPFTGYNGNTFATDNGATYTSGGRHQVSMFVWNNATVSWDTVQGADTFVPGDYYVAKMYGGTLTSYDDATEKSHRATPNGANRPVPFPDHSTITTNGGLSGVNAYGETYVSYIEDTFDPLGTNPTTWGLNFLQVSNPYSCNLDLSYIGFVETTYVDKNGNNTQDADEPTLNDGNNIASLRGVQKYDGVSFDPSVGNTNYQFQNTTILKATANANGELVGGDVETLLVKPFEAFLVKTDGDAGQNFVFNDGLKTFSYNSRSAASFGTGDDVNGITFRTSTERNRPNSADQYYQVELELRKNGNLIGGSNTYVVANETINNGINGRLEALSSMPTNKTYFYTKEEFEDDNGIDPTYESLRYYINQINTDYLGVPIPLFLNLSSADAGEELTIDFNLMVNLVELKDAQQNFEDPNVRYYFHDRQEDVIFLINADSQYTFSHANSTGERFELFYGAPTSLGVDEGTIDDLIDATIVYTGSDDNPYIRFDKDWKNADVKVYSAVGQLVHIAKDVDTSEDYRIPTTNNNTATFIVNIQNNDTGEVVTKKFVK